MSYPHNNPGYNYGAPPPSSQPPYSYGQQPQPSSSQAPYSYGQPPPPGPHSSTPYTQPPPPGPHSSTPYAQPPPSGPHSSIPYAQPPPPGPHSTSSAPPYSSDPYKPPKDSHPQPYGAQPAYPQPSSPYGGGYPPAQNSPFASLVPSGFPPGTDPNLVACFQIADRDNSGFIDDVELQTALSSYNESFSLRTVHLLMYNFTNSNSRKIGPREFTSVFYSLQNWRSIFEKFDRDRSGKIDASELREALLSLGFSVSPGVLELLISKFDKTGRRNKAIEYGNFIECCITVKGLTEKFKEKDTSYTGSASFTYENFMLTVLPFLIA